MPARHVWFFHDERIGRMTIFPHSINIPLIFFSNLIPTEKKTNWIVAQSWKRVSANQVWELLSEIKRHFDKIPSPVKVRCRGSEALPDDWIILLFKQKRCLAHKCKVRKIHCVRPDEMLIEKNCPRKIFRGDATHKDTLREQGCYMPSHPAALRWWAHGPTAQWALVCAIKKLSS